MNIMKTTSVTLLIPGESLVFENVEVAYHDKEIIRFTEREDTVSITEDEVDTDQVTVTDYTSNAPYLITEMLVGPKSLLK
jgi:hypothetical protein